MKNYSTQHLSQLCVRKEVFGFLTCHHLHTQKSCGCLKVCWRVASLKGELHSRDHWRTACSGHSCSSWESGQLHTSGSFSASSVARSGSSPRSMRCNRFEQVPEKSVKPGSYFVLDLETKKELLQLLQWGGGDELLCACGKVPAALHTQF